MKSRQNNNNTFKKRHDMLKKTTITPFILLFLATFLLSVSVAQSASIKDRLAARIPAINGLKDKGAIGENNKGFLEFRGKKQPQKNVVNAENGDRRKVYQAIGKKQGASAALVGQRRAKTIAAKSKAGHWLQKPDGGWYKK
jgi:uncharacterized protein YdbL (DUF1318 family)